MAQARAVSWNFDRRRTNVFDGHQLDHSTSFWILVIANKRGRLAAGDHAHAQVLAVPFELALHVVAGDGGMIDGGEEHSEPLQQGWHGQTYSFARVCRHTHGQ